MDECSSFKLSVALDSKLDTSKLQPDATTTSRSHLPGEQNAAEIDLAGPGLKQALLSDKHLSYRA
jgi:hypothetical protein